MASTSRRLHGRCDCCALRRAGMIASVTRRIRPGKIIRMPIMAGPGETEIVDPVVGDEADAAKEEDGAEPSTKACGDGAGLFEFGSADLAEGRADEALMVVDCAAKTWPVADLLAGVVDCFAYGGEDGAVGSCVGGVEAGVVDSVFAGKHALIPRAGVCLPSKSGS